MHVRGTGTRKRVSWDVDLLQHDSIFREELMRSSALTRLVAVLAVLPLGGQRADSPEPVDLTERDDSGPGLVMGGSYVSYEMARVDS